MAKVEETIQEVIVSSFQKHPVKPKNLFSF
jgi:hypothetical protein